MVPHRRLLLTLGISGLVASCVAIAFLVRFAITTSSGGGRAGAIVLSVLLLGNVVLNIERIRRNHQKQS